ncbi:MAG: hypothetical protein ICV84_05980 [Flavisolibacter sp.]|nr:hypothetical protein [Flavisolibacter sp.]
MKKIKVTFSLLDKGGARSTGDYSVVVETKLASDAGKLIEMQYPNARSIFKRTVVTVLMFFMFVV